MFIGTIRSWKETRDDVRGRKYRVKGRIDWFEDERREAVKQLKKRWLGEAEDLRKKNINIK